MKKCIFLLLNLLQGYASLSILPGPDPESDLIKACPEPDYYRDCGCWVNPPFQDNCKPGEICCDTYCGRSICQTPEPKCPNPSCTTPTPMTTTTGSTITPITPGSTITPITPGSTTQDESIMFNAEGDLITTPPVNNLCDPMISDSCPIGQKCCFNGCYNECVEPVVECDYFDCSYNGCLDPFSEEDTCPDGLYCCYDGCENKCVKPDYYRLSCPNDSIIEHEDVWTKFCLNDCNCPDYQLCCDSPCDCDLDICRDFVVQSATCPESCYDNNNGGYCWDDDQCLGQNKLCCDCNWYGNQCVDPVFGPPESGYIPTPLDEKKKKK